MTDADLLRGLAREQDATGTSAVADDLRRIADALATAAGQRELLATAEAERAAALKLVEEHREHLRAAVIDAQAAERERADTVARANLAVIRAGEEAGRLREELNGVYANLGRITIAEWQARRGAADE